MTKKALRKKQRRKRKKLTRKPTLVKINNKPAGSLEDGNIKP